VTFESFPERESLLVAYHVHTIADTIGLSHMLQATHPSLRVESHVFPAYQTRGELVRDQLLKRAHKQQAAVQAFIDWLTELIVRLECDHGEGGGAGKAKIVLMGHSMGGLLIADAAKEVVDSARPGDPLWPKIVGIFGESITHSPRRELTHSFRHALPWLTPSYIQTSPLAGCYILRASSVCRFRRYDVIPSSRRAWIR